MSRKPTSGLVTRPWDESLVFSETKDPFRRPLASTDSDDQLDLASTFEQDAELATMLSNAANRFPCWAADIVPLPAVLTQQPDVRPTLAVVEAGGTLLTTEMLFNVSPETPTFSRQLFNVLRATCSLTRARPRQILVRDAEVAAALDDLAATQSWRAVKGRLSTLDGLIAFMRGEMVGGVDSGNLCLPCTWAAWDLPDRELSSFFDLASTYFNASLRRTRHNQLGKHEHFRLELPSGETWTAVPLGQSGEEVGLAVFEDAAEAYSLMETSKLDPPSLEGQGVIVTFASSVQLHPAMRREFARNQWPVATSEAYPRAWTLNTRGGGLSRSQFALVRAALALLADPKLTETLVTESPLGEDLSLPSIKAHRIRDIPKRSK